MSEPGPADRQRTPWWFHLMIGLLGLSASLTYVRTALMDPGADPRNWVIAAVWAAFGGLWVAYALVGRQRGS